MECNGINFWNDHYGCLNSSTIEETSLGGGEVKEETIKETETFINIPIKPIPSGEIPNNQLSDVFSSGAKNLK